MYTCRECERPINQATELCPYCGADLTASPQPAEEAAAKKPNLLIVLLRWGVLLAGVWAFLWFILPERSGNVAAQAETRAMEMLREAGAALQAYADACGGSFPSSLDALPRESSENVRQAAQRAQREGYTLSYTPGPGEADGRVGSFALRAQAGHYGYRNFFLDQSGVLRATRESRPATADDPPI